MWVTKKLLQVTGEVFISSVGMCSEMDLGKNPASFAAPDWIEALLQECEDEAKTEACWPTLLLQSKGRKVFWNFCSILGVNAKGVPGCACRLLEQYLSRHIRNFMQETRDSAEWERYKDILASRIYLLMVSCIQLAAKMSDLLSPLSATMVRNTLLLRAGVVHTKTEIVDMEFHVYSTLEFRIPLWTTLEVAEFLASQIGLGEPAIIEAVGLVVNLTEFHRNLLELHMRCWSETSDTPGSSSSISAAARYMRSSVPDPTDRVATFVRTSYSFVKALSDTILNHIIPDKIHIPILRKRRLR